MYPETRCEIVACKNGIG